MTVWVLIEDDGTGAEVLGVYSRPAYAMAAAHSLGPLSWSSDVSYAGALSGAVYWQSRWYAGAYRVQPFELDGLTK